jgi:hypothetical protein
MKYDVELWMKSYITIDADNPSKAEEIALETWTQYLDDIEIHGVDVYDESGEMVGGS